jgi:glycosyltransferase involved in cell wall biosynthesis
MAARGIPGENISVIHCGIDAKLYTNDKEYAKFDHPSILYLGRIKKYKSIHHLVDAFKLIDDRMPAARLRIVGDGDYLPKLQAQAEQLGLSESVEFPGFVSKEKKVEYLCRSHVAVYPSLKEGWGLTNIEANSCGTTVVAANTPGLRDSVKDGFSGLLYDFGDIAQLAEKIEQVLTDSELRAKLEAGALEWAARFNWDTAADEFLYLCRQVAKSG